MTMDFGPVKFADVECTTCIPMHILSEDVGDLDFGFYLSFRVPLSYEAKIRVVQARNRTQVLKKKMRGFDRPGVELGSRTREALSFSAACLRHEAVKSHSYVSF